MESSETRNKASLVLKNPWIVDVFTQSIYRSDIAITGERISGIGYYSGETEIDCEGYYVTPGFIDAHVHVESSKVIPPIFSRVLIKKGVTVCIADPHEIANVLGAEGIRFMLDSSRDGMMDIFFMLPSCVPAVEFEDNGAELGSDDFGEFINCRQVLGLGEVMDVPSVISGKPGMVKKLEVFKDKVIDGHCPGISSEWLDSYIFAGVHTDHECSTPKQAEEEIKRGMYVMLREGSAARNLRDLLPAVNSRNFHRFLFCTDDKDISDIVKEGSIDHNIRLAIKNGLDPVMAITIASLNAAECYGLKNRGAIAPGNLADLVILKSLEDVEIAHVIRRGQIYREQKYECLQIELNSSMNIGHVEEGSLCIKADGERINTIKVKPGSIETERVERRALMGGGLIKGIESPDYMKIGVFERHKRTGKYALGFVEGLGIKNCSIAQTIAHDSHNIIVVGDNDRDMVMAVNRIIDIKGGIVLVSQGEILQEIKLPVAGLMTCSQPEEVIQNLRSMENAINKFKKDGETNIFLTLSFLSLPVIPDIKITARGIYDFHEGRFINLFCD